MSITAIVTPQLNSVKTLKLGAALMFEITSDLRVSLRTGMQGFVAPWSAENTHIPLSGLTDRVLGITATTSEGMFAAVHLQLLSWDPSCERSIEMWLGQGMSPLCTEIYPYINQYSAPQDRRLSTTPLDVSLAIDLRGVTKMTRSPCCELTYNPLMPTGPNPNAYALVFATYNERGAAPSVLNVNVTGSIYGSPIGPFVITSDNPEYELLAGPAAR